MSNLLDALYSNAWAITDEKLRDIEAMLQRHTAGEALPEAKIEQIVRSNEEASFEGMSGFGVAEGGGYLKKDDTAYVPMHGTIVNRAGMVARASGAVSPQSVQKNLRSAAQDSDVRRIVLDIDSPGGTVSGTVPTANTVKEVAKEKEVIAVADNTVASAAYWIGSQASRLVVGESAEVGSIGVIAVHRDHTEKMEEEGIESTIVRVQNDKALGHPEESFSEEAREQWEERLNGYYDLFTEAVAGSMNVSEDDLRDSIGSRSYIGRDAVEAGLADEIGSLASVIESKNTLNPNDTTRAMAQSDQDTEQNDIESRLENLEAELESERERADQAEARAEQAEEQAEKAAEIAEEQSQALAEQRKKSLADEAKALVDDQIIGRGKAHQSQRDEILSDCKAGGEFDADRIGMVRNMYASLADGCAVPVESDEMDKGAARDEETSRSGYNLRADLESQKPSKYE